MNESKKKDRYEDAKKFVRYSDGGNGLQEWGYHWNQPGGNGIWFISVL